MDGERGVTEVPKGRDGFLRWGPYGLLGLATILAGVTSEALMTATGMGAASGLVLAGVVLQLWWGRTVNRRPEPELEPGPGSLTYYVLRTLIAGALTWLNPFFAIYASLGYLDTGYLLRPRWVRLGLLVNVVSIAGSESGGLPPRSLEHWMVFVGLYAMNSVLVLYFVRLYLQEAEHARVERETFQELRRSHAQLAQALEENAGLHDQLLVQAREAGVGDERRRLAAEIHDTLAQGLAGIIAQLQVAADRVEPAARGQIELAVGLARQNLAQARRSVHNLAPSELEHDALPRALEKATEDWSSTSGVRAGFTVTGTPEQLHAEVEATLLRIAQEALANVDRHARARRAGVTLSYMDDEVTLDIRDDGRGFALDQLPARTVAGGFGLVGMRARAERLAGTVDIETEPGGGTAISARVPLVRHD